MLNIGDRVYIAGYGIGTIRNVRLRDICGRIRRYYYISLISDNIDFFIQENQLKRYKVKKLTDKAERKNILYFLRHIHERVSMICMKDLGVIIKRVEIK